MQNEQQSDTQSELSDYNQLQQQDKPDQEQNPEQYSQDIVQAVQQLLNTDVDDYVAPQEDSSLNVLDMIRHQDDINNQGQNIQLQDGDMDDTEHSYPSNAVQANSNQPQTAQNIPHILQRLNHSAENQDLMQSNVQQRPYKDFQSHSNQGVSSPTWTNGGFKKTADRKPKNQRQYGGSLPKPKSNPWVMLHNGSSVTGYTSPREYKSTREYEDCTFQPNGIKKKSNAQDRQQVMERLQQLHNHGTERVKTNSYNQEMHDARKEMEELQNYCTFRPVINQTSAEICRIKTKMGQKAPFIDRVQSWAEKREYQLQIHRQLKQDMQYEECTFKPDTAQSQKSLGLKDQMFSPRSRNNQQNGQQDMMQTTSRVRELECNDALHCQYPGTYHVTVKPPREDVLFSTRTPHLYQEYSQSRLMTVGPEHQQQQDKEVVIDTFRIGSIRQNDNIASQGALQQSIQLSQQKYYNRIGEARRREEVAQQKLKYCDGSNWRNELTVARAPRFVEQYMQRRKD